MPDPLNPLTLTLAEVAALLGKSTDWLYRHRSELERDHGFPPPIPLLRVWERAAVVRWLELQRPPHLRPDPLGGRPAGPANDTAADPESVRRTLASRAAGLAASLQ